MPVEVDESFRGGDRSAFEVVLDADGRSMSAMLNQTNIANNNNKFFFIQLLREVKTDQYGFWARWGRVGLDGQTSMKRGKFDAMKSEFLKKFKDKTMNDWEDRHNFEPRKGKYTLIQMEGDEHNDEELKVEGVGEPTTSTPSVGGKKTRRGKKLEEESESKAVKLDLDSDVRSLVSMIADQDRFRADVTSMGYNINRMPLGKLKKQTVLQAFSTLKSIVTSIASGHRSTLKDLSSDFYTLIPHDFGMRTPPIIGDMEHAQAKLEMLKMLLEVQLAVGLLSVKTGYLDPVDRAYSALQARITSVPTNDKRYKFIHDMFNNTYGSTHRSRFTAEPRRIWEVEREGEAQRFAESEKEHGKQTHLMWHGSRVSNMVGIISQGLRIAPPEAPVTGYMFGKGVYFASTSTKSAQYCCATRSRPTGLVLLAEVRLGKEKELFESDYNASDLPKGYGSTHAIGKECPSKVQSLPGSRRGTMKAFIGKSETNSKHDGKGPLQFDEYIIYNTNQAQLKFVVEIQFIKPE